MKGEGQELEQLTYSLHFSQNGEPRYALYGNFKHIKDRFGRNIGEDLVENGAELKEGKIWCDGKEVEREVVEKLLLEARKYPDENAEDTPIMEQLVQCALEPFQLLRVRLPNGHQFDLFGNSDRLHSITDLHKRAAMVDLVCIKGKVELIHSSRIRSDELELVLSECNDESRKELSAAIEKVRMIGAGATTQSTEAVSSGGAVGWAKRAVAPPPPSTLPKGK